MQRIAAGAAALVVSVGLGATWYVTQSSGGDQFAQCRSSSVAGQASVGGPFELVNTQGRTVTDVDVITEPSLIYFGYTFCPDVCPLDAARNADAVDVLAERGVSVTPVFISIDPERDTPEVLGDFVEILHDKMIGLTGSEEQVAAASKAYRTYFKRHDSDDEFYLVDHSSLTYLVLPEVGFVDVFRRDISAERMADTVACFAEAA